MLHVLLNRACRCNGNARGNHAPGVRAGKIEPFEIVGCRVANIAEAALSQERLDLALIDPEKILRL
jgi:hypothetical protein